ncbi:recombinase family protein [Sphingomonas aurantiaca]|uniref:recombinase family protein n=1 Tax=Sphingomonas aurantiaca TaxID=185949 RepID=UPI002FDF719E
MPRCAIYARFSSDRQSQTSADDQVADCRARAEREGWEVVQVYADLAISGASNKRPGMTSMLADAAAGSFDIVLAEALDRIARNQADIATIYQRLVFADVRIETLSEGHVNELHIGLKGTMGALFLKDLGEKIRRGQRGTVSRGRIPGGLCYGYDVVRELNEKGELEAGRRRINPDQAAVVVRIITEYVAGRSPKLIAHGLNLDGIPSARAVNGVRMPSSATRRE